MQFLIQGTATLQGRLDLGVQARTGSVGPEPLAVRLLGLNLPAFGPIPLSVVLQATSYLANKVVRLRVSGTVRRPIIRVEPAGLLTEEAVRFFLGRALLP